MNEGMNRDIDLATGAGDGNRLGPGGIRLENFSNLVDEIGPFQPIFVTPCPTGAIRVVSKPGNNLVINVEVTTGAFQDAKEVDLGEKLRGQ